MSTPVYKVQDLLDHAASTGLGSPPPTPQSRLDEAIRRLREGARMFVQLGIDERIRLAESMQRGMLCVAARAVQAGCKAKGIAAGTPVEGEEWATGPWGVVRQLRLVRESLQAIKIRGNTPIGPVTETSDGRLSVRVFPGNGTDALLFKDITVDVRTQAGTNERTLEESRASFYKRPVHDGTVVLVLGGGNIAAIPAMDVITKMFNEGKVCLLKMHPVNAYLGPFYEQAFAEPIARDFLAVVYGDASEGSYLAHHHGVDEVHITGSDKTHDLIVWGPPGAERDTRERRNEPLLNKPITSELGNISPVILVPGPYTHKQLRFQAEDVASYMVMNASHLCNAAKMLVTPKGWRGSDHFVYAMQEVCSTVAPRKAYYPGARERWRMLTTGRSQVEIVGEEGPDSLPWTFIRNLNPSVAVEPLCIVEPFCAIVSEMRLGSSDPIEFLDKAVDFANEKLWGTLAATLVVHPTSLKDPVIAQAVESAIARLRYGTVTVNGFSGLSFAFASPPWGAYPGASLDDIQSGRGFVHNTSMLEGIEKVVMRCPLTTFPKPGYFVSHRTAHKVLPRLVAMEENASWRRVAGIVWHAMRG